MTVQNLKKDFLPLLKDCVVEPKAISIKHSQSNGIVERVRQVFGDMVQTHDLKQYIFDDVDPWEPVLNEISWAIRSTPHTSIKESLGRLVFGRDMLSDIPYIPDWDKIAKQKQNETNKSNLAENKNCLE